MEQSAFGRRTTTNYKGAAYGWQRNVDALEKVPRRARLSMKTASHYHRYW